MKETRKKMFTLSLTLTTTPAAQLAPTGKFVSFVFGGSK